MTKPAKGEEWKDMDIAIPDYDPGSQAELVAEAEQFIENKRKQNTTLRCVDRQGNAISGQSVQIELIRHDFQFGEQLWSLDAQYRNGLQQHQYTRSWQDLFQNVFNSANNLCYWTERPANDASKSEEHQGETRVENFAQTVDWTLANGMTAKGHPLFWSIPKCIPDWVKRYDMDTFWKFAEVRVRNLVSRFKGQVTVWDAVNEALWEAAPEHLNVRDWPHVEPTDVMADYIEKVLTWCREEDPDATFLINDYGLISQDQPKTNAKGEIVTASSQRKRYVALAKELIRRGCAPDALGLQAHTGWVPLSLLNTCLNEMGQAGLPLHITEFWASEKPLLEQGIDPIRVEELTAEYVRQFVTVAFGNPHLDAFYFWGFMGSAVKMNPNGGYSVKPVYESVRKLLRETWWIKEDLHTNAEGELTTKLFPGTYAIRRHMPNGQWTGTRFHHHALSSSQTLCI
jgi:GH35 family endo-1,4-beta-xylanase